MAFLRRLLGTERAEPEPAEPVSAAEADPAEEAYQRDLLREEHARMTDLQHRQLRYSDYAWRPADQGGERRAEDADEGSDGG